MTTPPPTPVPERQQHELARALARAGAVLGERGRARVVVDRDRQAEPLAHLGAEVEVVRAGCSRRRARLPVRWSTRAGTPNPTAATSGVRSSRTISTSAVEQGFLRLERRRALERPLDAARPSSTRPARIFVPPRSTPMTRAPAKVVGTLLLRMAPDEKPYRVYRGGRVKGKVPGAASKPRRGNGASRPEARPRARHDGGGPARSAGCGCRGAAVAGSACVADRRARAARARRRLGASRATSPFSSGVSDANKRVQPGHARPRSRSRTGCCSRTRRRSCCSAPTPRPSAGRSGDRHSDSIMLLRTDPSHHRLSYLSIPRDLLVPVAGLGNAKINAAYQAGGAPLAIRTIREYTGVEDQPRRDRRLRRTSRT